VSAALSVVIELNIPLSGTMTTASATHQPRHPLARQPTGRRFPGRRCVDCHSLASYIRVTSLI
jgi:hypothetical protein